MAALLTDDAGNVEKIAEFITECRRMDIPVLPPDVNESSSDFTIVRDSAGKEAIRFGLYSIKNFGEGVSGAIIEERENKGKFKSLSDFLARVQGRNLNRKSLESLIKCGALDAFAERGAMFSNIEDLLAYSREFAVMSQDQDSLFNTLPESGETSSITLEKTAPIELNEKLAWEKELLGLYVSGHPLDRFKKILEKRTVTIKKIDEELKEGMLTVASGIVSELRPIITKSGDRMAFLKISDFTGSIEIVAFPKIFSAYQKLCSGVVQRRAVQPLLDCLTRAPYPLLRILIAPFFHFDGASFVLLAILM